MGDAELIVFMERRRATQTAWESYIGGYQPAQKWLKDRKARALIFNDILHYQNVALVETRRMMY